MVAAALAGLLGSLITLLTPAPAMALTDPQLRAVTFNMQGGNKWGEVKALMPDADVIMMQEATTTPDGAQLRQLEWASNELDHETVNNRGKSSLKYRLYKAPYHSSGRARGVRGVLYYLKVLDKKEWGNWADGDGGPEDDPDIGSNAPKSMAIWVREGLAPADDGQDIERLDIVTPTVDNNRWVTSRPAFGIQLGGTWYFDIHAASIRVGPAVNPHTRALVNAVRAKKQGQPWQIMGDFNSLPDTLAPAPGDGEPYNKFYATTNQVPGGPPASTQLSAGALDYVVAHDQLRNLRVSVKRGTGADHLPVRSEPDRPDPCDMSKWTYSTVHNPVGRTPRAAAGDACEDSSAVVSMGDSYISGEGGRWAGNANASPSGDVWGTDRKDGCGGGQDCVYGATSYEGGNRCDRSDVAPIMSAVFGGIPRERRFNIACSGARTEHIIDKAYQGEAPQAEQLARLAKDYDVKTIVVSIGGNDLGFSDIIRDCVQRYWVGVFSGTCNSGSPDTSLQEKPGQTTPLQEKLEKTREGVHNALQKIRSVMTDAGYTSEDYELVLSTYPNPLPRSTQMQYGFPTRYTTGGCPFRNADADWARDELMPDLTAALRAASLETGASLLNVEDAFAGHELCNQNAKQATSGNSRANPLPEADAEWVRWIPYQFDMSKGWLWGSQGDKQEAVHPNAYGQKALGACLTAFAAAGPETPGRRRTFTCAGTPGKGSDGVGLRQTVKISAVPQGSAGGDAGVLRRAGSDSKWVSTGPDDSQLSRWFINGELPEPGGRLETTIRNESGQYLQGDGGATRQWASVSDTPRLWTLERQKRNELAFRITTEGGKWCLTPWGTWGALWPCSTEEPLAATQLWQIDTSIIKIIPRPLPIDRAGPLKSAKGDLVADVDNANPEPGTRVKVLAAKGNAAQKWWTRATPEGWQVVSALDGGPVLAHDTGRHEARLAKDDGGGAGQVWQAEDAGGGWTRLRNGGLCLTAAGPDETLALKDCASDDPGQRWQATGFTPEKPQEVGDAGSPFDDSADDRGAKPASSGDCRPEGMTPTAGVAARYCDVYDNAGREWVGNNRTRRTVGYFTGWRAGATGDPAYLASNIPWSKVTHVNYAFAKVDGNRISIGDVNDPKNPATGMTWDGDRNAMDPSLPYKGHFNLLNTYKKKHPAVKTLISVGGWADTRNFYAMATNADGSVNQAGIETFADSVADFLDRYGFNGVDIDYEYPTALPNTGNPNDWDVSDPRRKGLQQGYNALMKTLREKLDRAGAGKGRYYLLTSAGSASGYLVRGLDAGQSLQYQDYVNVMSYDLHGSWNKYVGPQAPLYDTGQDNELAAAGIYNDQGADTKDYQKNGYFNIDWAYHYYRGALPPGRINLGIPYYSRGWQSVQGGTDGLWGTSAMPDQSKCPLGVGGRGPANGQDCGLGATGIDNVWHDTEDGREVGAGSNPLWHTKNLQDGRTPGYLKSYGVDPATGAGKLTGSYAEKYSDPLQSSWLWNDAKKVFLSTENEKSIDAKVKYIADKGIGGAMIWELAGDYTKRSNGEWGMGYDLTTRLDNALKGAGAYGNTTGGGKPLPSQVIDVKAELVDFPTTVGDMWPMQPKLRITNNSKVALAQGTEISFDLPTSAPPVVKDGAWKEMSGIVPGHTGPNAGGLKGDFHRVTIKLGYCEDVPAGKSKDIEIKYYLPVTGPANVTFRIGGKDYGSTGDKRRAVTTVDPPTVSGAQCQAAPWQAHAYNPNPSFAFWQTGDKWIIEDRNSGNVLDHPGSWTDAHLSMKQTGNANQLWTVSEDDQGWYHIKSATSGHDQCLGATTARGTLTVRDCDGKIDQWWRLVPLSTDQATAGKPALDRQVIGGPKHGSSYALGGFADGTDWWKTPVYLAAPANSATASSTKIIAGDPDGAWASTASWNGFYWRAKWWNKATDEPGKSDAWQRLGPTP
ncbi:glycosyl hydrolase family 18 protein [Kitasatospora sp. NPDC059811]|uniref:glycosyl hydrolase family 18 protein n=1 Tax=Streptomycetaceae TaxID=2062 RepID=UPI001FCB1A4D|nr:glycosyl hydrolase family 18 protein [Streptomyces sp. MJM8645]